MSAVEADACDRSGIHTVGAGSSGLTITAARTTNIHSVIEIGSQAAGSEVVALVAWCTAAAAGPVLQLQHAPLTIADDRKHGSPTVGSVTPVDSVNSIGAVAAIVSSDHERAKALPRGSLDCEVGAIETDAGDGSDIRSCRAVAARWSLHAAQIERFCSRGDPTRYSEIGTCSRRSGAAATGPGGELQHTPFTITYHGEHGTPAVVAIKSIDSVCAVCPRTTDCSHCTA